MSSNNSCFLLILISLILLSEHPTLSSSCQENCGGVLIHFPFGIGKDCYLNKWYAIECVNSSISGELVPLLSVIKKEVESINLPSLQYNYVDYESSIYIKNEIASKGCSSDGEEFESLLNLTGTPFYIDNRNLLIAVGCDSTTSLTHIEPNMVGCETSCGPKHQTRTESYLSLINCYREVDYSSCNNKDIVKGGAVCDGIKCCQANMPNEIRQIIGVKIDNTTITGGCRVAFLTYEYYTSYPPQRVYAERYSTIRLGWFIQTMNHSYEDSLKCSSREKYEYEIETNNKTSCVCDYKAHYSRCACDTGYEGNPYLPDGCKDINECLIKDDNTYGDHKRCPGGKCVNLQGYYKCVYTNTNQRPLAIGLGASFGSLIFVCGIYLLYKFIKKQRRLKQKKKFYKRNGGLLLQQQLSSTGGNVEKTKVFSSKELEKATENFSLKRILGQGGQGTVYKGMLADGRILAVKNPKLSTKTSWKSLSMKLSFFLRSTTETS